MGWGTTGTFCLLLEKFLNFPSSWQVYVFLHNQKILFHFQGVFQPLGRKEEGRSKDQTKQVPPPCSRKERGRVRVDVRGHLLLRPEVRSVQPCALPPRTSRQPSQSPSPELWGGNLTLGPFRGPLPASDPFQSGFYLPTIVCITSQKPSVTWKTSPRQALSLTVYGETRSPNTERDSGEGKHRKAMHHQPAAASRRQPAALAEAASPHGPHRPCPRHPRETEAGLVLPAPHSRVPAEGQLPSSSWQRVAEAGPACGREAAR